LVRGDKQLDSVKHVIMNSFNVDIPEEVERRSRLPQKTFKTEYNWLLGYR